MCEEAFRLLYYKVPLYPACVFSVQKSLKGSCNPIRFSVYLSASNACTWFGFPVLSILVQIWLSQRTFFGMLPKYSAFFKKKRSDLILAYSGKSLHKFYPEKNNKYDQG